MNFPMVTVAMLAYKSSRWADFAVKGLQESENRVPYLMMVVGNDPSAELERSGRLTHVYRDPHPEAHYLSRVYRAWNFAIQNCKTPWIVLINSDMRVSDHWLDELVRLKMEIPKSVPTSLLVESGRIHSAFPEYVRNLGTTTHDPKMMMWRSVSDSVRERGVHAPGRLYMPCLLECDTFLASGGYPPGNIGGIPGDQIAFSQLGRLGFHHFTCMGSVVYHTQEGEMRND